MLVMAIRNLEFSTGEFYHLYNRGVDKREIFKDDYDSGRFIKLLYLCNDTKNFEFRKLPEGLPFGLKRERTLVDIGAYCLMPNHFHLLIHEKEGGGISTFVQKLATAHSMYFNKKHSRTGRLFEGPFKAKHLDSDNYLNYIFAYIHLNPIDLVESSWKEKGIKNLKEAKRHLENYKFSSCPEYLGINRPEKAVLNREAFPDYFSGEHDFDSFIESWLKFPAEEKADYLQNMP